MLNITVPMRYDEEGPTGDFAVFVQIIDMGIDSRLEAFTKSIFQTVDWEGHSRLDMTFHPNEESILLRRLVSLETEEADRWADDIVMVQYNQEVI